MVADGSGAPYGVDSSGPGEGEEGDCGAVECGCGGALKGADREARNARVLLPRKAGASGEYEGLARGAGEGGRQGFPLARSPAHLGELARAGRNAAPRAAGAGRLGVRGDGAQVRASIERASGRLCGPAFELETGCTGRRGYIPATRPEMRTGCIAATRSFIWRARQDLNPRPPGS